MSEVTAKADRVKRLLEDPDLQQAFEDVRQAILQGFSETPPTKTEQLVLWRERLHLLDSVKANLERAIEDGNVERFHAQEQERPPFLGDILAWRKNKRA